MEHNALIYGKNTIEKIVSIEVDGGTTTLFREDLPPLHFPNKFWILSDSPLNKRFVKLNGDLHYKYGWQTSNREEYLKMRNIWRSKDIYNIYDPIEAAQVKDGYTYFKGLKHTDISILSFDIETTSLRHDSTAKVLLISNTFRKNGQLTRKLFCYDEYENDGEMLEDWCNWVRSVDPSVIAGHNILTYDLPYIQHIANRYNISLNLGRNSSPIQFDKRESKFRKDATQFLHYHKPKIYGREVIDTMFLSIRYDVARNFPNYKLKDIIKFLKLESKERQYYDASQIRNKYLIPEEWEKIKQYCIHDSDESLALYDKMIPPFFYLTQSIPKSFQQVIESASGSQLNSIMVRAYLQEAHSLPQANETASYEGAISLGNPGIFNNVYKLDVKSLYPSIMIQYKVYNKQKDPKAYFLELVNIFTEKRLYHKSLADTDEYHDNLQAAFKIFINSCYGFLGAKGLLFNSPDDAAFVTRKGREILSDCITWLEENNLRLVNADTDSASFCKQTMEEITPEERSAYKAAFDSLSPDKIQWEDDGYFLKLIVFKAKNYITYGWDKKEQKNKIKAKGSALKDSKKPPALKEFCDEVINSIIFERDDFCQIYFKYVREIMDVKDVARWSTKKTVTEKVLNAKRTNEQKVMDAIENSEYVEGDRCFVFFKKDGSLCLAENFDGDYSNKKLLDALFKATKIFDSVLPTANLFTNFALKRNEDFLSWLIGRDVRKTIK